ncbi:hypothetical protein [Pseudogemmobacter humi]|uniref:Uncharacterized protein n=1 Tax=Pseudogemmobacter humi TaxID=2483812 RepID=A0A3P5X739_9RHOB|nr:hypothetical protein [Pseudogemmobacter humi]VDC30193.1 hypothetical protein XINFAN_02472 [Pseudogemmobacter humi]
MDRLITASIAALSSAAPPALAGDLLCEREQICSGPGTCRSLPAGDPARLVEIRGFDTDAPSVLSGGEETRLRPRKQRVPDLRHRDGRSPDGAELTVMWMRTHYTYFSIEQKVADGTTFSSSGSCLLRHSDPVS